jgi:hypothetical protein
MMRFLATHVPGDIVVAVVFGSLGTREEIPYSDFDALVVLRRETVDSRVRLVRCARALFRAQKFMFRQDPLQHHGWFVLTEGDLDDYPEHHLPVASLLGGQALCPPDGATLSLRPRLDLPLLRDRFRALCSGVRSISGRITPTSSSYLWKSLLSEFMLLPALYVQVRDGRGIAKKESFGAARVDFTASEWEIMDDVSRVRREWTLPMPRWRRWFMTRPGVVWRKAAKRLSPPPPRVALSVLTPPAMGRLVALATSMAGKLGCSDGAAPLERGCGQRRMEGREHSRSGDFRP